MHIVRALVASLLPIPAVAAQTVNLIAATPIVATAQSGSQAQTTTLPPGLLGAFTQVAAAPTPTSSAALMAMGGGGEHGLFADVTYGCVVPAGGTASIAPCELLLALSYPVAVQTDLRLSRELAGPAGAPIPQLQVDVRDDGSYEFTEQTAANLLTLQLTIGPSPVVLRLRLAASSTVPGLLSARLVVAATPASPVVTTAIGPCTPFDFTVQGRFDGDIDWELTTPTSTMPAAVVFGLGISPWLLGQTAAAPCLLLPRPDLVLLLPFPGPGYSTLNIPQSVRPIRLWAQAVMPMGPQVATSAAYSVFAQ